jgi:hypothetical protein
MPVWGCAAYQHHLRHVVLLLLVLDSAGGDPIRSLCCAAGTRACNGNCCGRDQVCNWQMNQCVAINSEAGRQSFQSYRNEEFYRNQLYGAMAGGGGVYPYAAH